MNKEMENKLRMAIGKALDNIFDDEDIADSLDMYFGENTMALAAEAALNVIVAVSQVQKQGIDEGWWLEHEEVKTTTKTK